MITRKEFIKRSAWMAALPILGCKNQGLLSNTTNYSRPLTFDLHAHPGVVFYKGTAEYPGDEAFQSTIKKMNDHDITGAFFSLVSDMPLLKITRNGVVPIRSFQEGEGWTEYSRQLNDLKALLETSVAEICYSYGQMLRTQNVSALISVEGGDFLEGKLENVDRSYEEGIRSIQLVHYAPNEIGDLQTHKAIHEGLSNFGENVVKKMNKLGMIIDVAHASYETVKGVVDNTDRPIILSHSMLKDGSENPISARAISEDHALQIARTKGVIGAWPSGFSESLESFVDNTMRLIDVVGIDHVGLGTDMDANFKPVLTDYGQVSSWKEALIKKGLSKEEANKVSGGNAMRVLRQVLNA